MPLPVSAPTKTEARFGADEEDMKTRFVQLKETLALGGERGQAIIIIAFALIGLLLFAGLALDTATIYAGQSRLKRAVDAAALAGVVELPNQDAADARTRQFMLANGFDTEDTQVGTRDVSVSGLQRWAVTATHRVPLNFLPLINFDYADVAESAVAEYRSLVEMYTTQTGGTGMVGPVSLFNWGRWANPKFGDAITPQCYTCDGVDCDVYGAGRYICPSDANPDHVELYNESASGYPFRIQIPAGYSHDHVQIEIFDPDGWNQPIEGSVAIKHTTGMTTTETEVIELNEIDCNEHSDGNQNERMEPCLIVTGDPANPYWFMRIDETRSFYDRPATYSDLYNTETHYRLYYLRQRPDQSIFRALVADYVGEAADASTDMQWVVPPGWILDINCDDGSCDVPNIVENKDGSRSILLEVDGVSGYSKNGFDLWAGPPPTEPIPSDVNERNLYLLEHRDAHDPENVVIYGSGYLPLSVHAGGQITITFTLVPIDAAGLRMNLYHFDNDAEEGLGQIGYYLEGVEGWQTVGTLSLDGTWSASQPYVYQEPTSRYHDSFTLPAEFYGAYLEAVYTPRYVDTPVENATWRIEYEGPVGDTFVRLIE